MCLGNIAYYFVTQLIVLAPFIRPRSLNPSPVWKQPSSFESAQRAKTARVDEIVRRAAQLQPPIPSDVLQHMPAFQAAHNIARPLQDAEWSQLQQRFQEQRADAERLAIDFIVKGKNEDNMRMENGVAPSKSKLNVLLDLEHTRLKRTVSISLGTLGNSGDIKFRHCQGI
jgi:hypothetical protein